MHLSRWVCVVRCIKAYTRRLHDVGQLFRSININRDLSALSFAPLTFSSLRYHYTRHLSHRSAMAAYTVDAEPYTRLYENHQIGCYFWTRNEEMFHFTQVLLALLPIFIIADAPFCCCCCRTHKSRSRGDRSWSLFHANMAEQTRSIVMKAAVAMPMVCNNLLRKKKQKRRIAHTSSSPRREVAQPKPNISQLQSGEQTTQQFFLAHTMMRWTYVAGKI